LSAWRAKWAAGRRGRLRDEGATAADSGADAEAAEGTRATQTEDAGATVDLTGGSGWAARIEPDPVRAAELAERFRARKARAEAQRDLQRLRRRHWSGERVVEESRAEIEWWEHPEADPYAVLGLLPGASMEEAASARRRVAHDCHPDRIEQSGEDPDVALRRMVAANAAYDRLRRALHPV
jgi:hypothetical protein